MLGWVDIRTFGLNLHLIIGVVVVGLLAIVLGLVAWTLLRLAAWKAQVRLVQEQAARAGLREDGQAYPPADRGLCDVCARAFEKVYHLPSGQRMCEDCYRRMVHEVHQQGLYAPPGAPQAAEEAGTDNERPRPGSSVIHPEGDGRQGL